MYAGTAAWKETAVWSENGIAAMSGQHMALVQESVLSTRLTTVEPEWLGKFLNRHRLFSNRDLVDFIVIIVDV